MPALTPSSQYLFSTQRLPASSASVIPTTTTTNHRLIAPLAPFGSTRAALNPQITHLMVMCGQVGTGGSWWLLSKADSHCPLPQTCSCRQTPTSVQPRARGLSPMVPLCHTWLGWLSTSSLCFVFISWLKSFYLLCLAQCHAQLKSQKAEGRGLLFHLG